VSGFTRPARSVGLGELSNGGPLNFDLYTKIARRRFLLIRQDLFNRRNLPTLAVPDLSQKPIWCEFCNCMEQVWGIEPLPGS
jgi:hypothetical protein